MKILVLAMLLCGAAAYAQTPAQLKSELRTKEAAAKQDADALCEVAKWADSKGLAAEAKRIYQGVLKRNATHEAANLGVGNVQVDGKWMSAKDAEALQKKKLAEEAKAKGWVEVDGIWVEKEQVDDAKRGIFHHEGTRVTKAEKLQLMRGGIRHPALGMIFDKKWAAEIEKGLFPVGGDRWVDEAEADKFHSDREHPWILRSTYTTLIGTLTLKQFYEIRNAVDQGYETLRPLLGLVDPTPPNRPVILAAATRDEFVGLGNSLGDASSAYGAFLGRPEARVTMNGVEGPRPVVFTFDEPKFGVYLARHAAGLGYAHGVFTDLGVEEVPAWFLQGLGSMASRFSNKGDAKFYGQVHIQRGGIKDLKAWFNSFDINGEMDPNDISFNVYQAGLLISFARDGGDPKAGEIMQGITAAITAGKGKGIDKDIDKLKDALIAAEGAVRGYLQALVAK